MMEIHTDLSRPALIHGGRLPWVQSPAAGVERRMLFRLGGEQAVATSIVRYAANSSFPSHRHPGGEEFLVLDGVFEDDHGRYPTGSYIRNPPGSAHAPRSTEGCVIFVRLRQFRPDDLKTVVDLPEISGAHRSPFTARPLFEGPNEHVAMVSWQPHETVACAAHGGLELLVLEGELAARGERLEHWSWLRLPRDMQFTGVAGSAGSTAWIKTAAPCACSAAPRPHSARLARNPNSGKPNT
jgi:quercetin dioxygenase-like cupin family protein